MLELVNFLDPAEITLLLLRDVLPHPRELGAGMSLEVGAGVRISKVSDLDICQTLLPPDYFDRSINGSDLDRFAISFLLRHQVTALAVSAHKTAGLKIESAECDRNELDLDGSEGDGVPIFGFSALGLHSRICPRGACRAFDYYDLNSCQKLASVDSVFCKDHQPEAFYDPNCKLELATTQAKMFSFYSDLSNLSEYSEEDLQELVSRFWKKINRTRFVLNNEVFKRAVETLEIEDLSSLKRLGLQGLRKIYLKKVFKSHPDFGGESARFIETKDGYEYLKAWLTDEQYR